MNGYNFYLLFVIIASIMSVVDCRFTYWYLKKLHDNGVPNVHSRELNPLARWYMKKLGIGYFSFFISVVSAQVIIWSCFYFMPEFGMMMYGALCSVFVYHYALYRELKRFKDDKKYWDLVKYKLLKTGDKI